MHEDNFIQNHTRLFPPSFWIVFDSFFNIFRMRVDERKEILTCGLKFMKWELVVVLWTFHQQYSRFRIRPFKSHMVYKLFNARISFPPPWCNKSTQWIIIEYLWCTQHCSRFWSWNRIRNRIKKYGVYIIMDRMA